MALAGRGGRDGCAFAVGGVYEVLQLFARLEEGDFLCRHFHLFTGFRIPPHSAAPLARAEAAETANLNLLPFLQRPDDAVENSFDDAFGFLTREFGYAQNEIDSLIASGVVCGTERKR